MKTFVFLAESSLYKGYKKTSILDLRCGRYNGYVGIIDGDNIPLSYDNSNVNYDNSLDARVEVHGGITFDDRLSKEQSIIPITEIPVDWWKYRIVGFDCAHLGDTEENCPFEFAKEEALRLQKQIEEIINK